MSIYIQNFETTQLKKDVPSFGSGDTVRVSLVIKDGNKERTQAFEGVVLGKRNRGLNSSFTVRKVANGETVERILQLHSPLISKIEVLKRGSVRKAKIYWLRDRFGRKARIKEERFGHKAKVQ